MSNRLESLMHAMMHLRHWLQLCQLPDHDVKVVVIFTRRKDKHAADACITADVNGPYDPATRFTLYGIEFQTQSSELPGPALPGPPRIIGGPFSR